MNLFDKSTTLSREDQHLYETKVGEIAIYAIFYALLFIIFQMFVWILAIIPLVFLPFFINLPKEKLSLISTIFWILLELVLFSILLILLLKSIKILLHLKPITVGGEAQISGNVKKIEFTEKSLEILMLSSALIAGLFYLMISQTQVGFRIVLTTFEIFSFIFMFIFILVRFLLTRKIRPMAVISLAMVFYFLWVTFRPLF